MKVKRGNYANSPGLNKAAKKLATRKVPANLNAALARRPKQKFNKV